MRYVILLIALAAGCSQRAHGTPVAGDGARVVPRNRNDTGAATAVPAEPPAPERDERADRETMPEPAPQQAAKEPPTPPGGQTGGDCTGECTCAPGLMCWNMYSPAATSGLANPPCREQWERRLASRPSWSLLQSYCHEGDSQSSDPYADHCHCVFDTSDGRPRNYSTQGVPYCIAFRQQCELETVGGRCQREEPFPTCDPTQVDSCVDTCREIEAAHRTAIEVEVELLATSCGDRWQCLAWSRQDGACFVIDDDRNRELELPCETVPEQAFAEYSRHTDDLYEAWLVSVGAVNDNDAGR